MANAINIPAGTKLSLNAVHALPKHTGKPEAEHTLFIMSHSFPGEKSGSKDILCDLQHLLVEKGFHTLRFDYRGCDKAGTNKDIFTIAGACEDFKHVVFWAEKQGYKKFALIGEGLGGAISIMNVDTNVSMLVLLWPVLDMKLYGETLLSSRQDLTQKDLERGYITQDEQKISIELLKELKNNNLEYALKEVVMPTVIIHGAQDKVIPAQQLDLAREHMRAKRIDITTFHDGEHAMDQLNHRSMIFHHIAEFANKNI